VEIDENQVKAMTIRKMRKYWPSSIVDHTQTLSGMVFKTVVWKYTIEVAITTKPVGFVQEAGDTTMSMVFQFDRKHPKIQVAMERSKGPVMVHDSIDLFLSECSSYLMGVVSEIETASTAPDQSIFGGG